MTSSRSSADLLGLGVEMSQRDKQAYMNATPMQREVVRQRLCDVLACLRASYLSYQTSHWQVIGGSFYGNHLLFARLYESVQKQVDELAEKLVGYLGREVVGLDHQIKHIAGYVMRWSQIDCHHKRGLQSEVELQQALKRAYEGIKQVNAMTLGLDDWIMATANAHEENEYLLQQALTPVPGQKQASRRATVKGVNKALMALGFAPDELEFVRGPINFYLSGDIGLSLYAGMMDQSGNRVSDRSVEDWVRDILTHVMYDENFAYSLTDAQQAKVKSARGRVASGAPTAEGDFYDNPKRKEVLDFAQTGAVSNFPEVAEAASEEDQLDIPEAEAVAEAEEAPPTPTEIAEEPGGAAVSTLNRLVIQSEDPDAAKAAEINRTRMAAWLKELDRG